MKSVTLSLIITLALSAQIWAQENPSGYGRIEQRQQDTFNRLLEHPAAKDLYAICDADPRVPLSAMAACMWDGYLYTDPNTGEDELIHGMSEANKAEVTAYLKAQSITPENTDPENPIYTEKDDFSIASANVENLVIKDDAAYKKLQDYMEKRLQEALYGEVQAANEGGSNTHKIVDQKTFYTLYKSQVSKNLIMSLSSFCIQAKFDTKTVKDKDGNDVQEMTLLIHDDPVKRQENIEENIQSLSTNIALGSGTIQGIDDISADARWNQCIQQIPEICYKRTVDEEEINDRNRVTKTSSRDSDAYTKRQACLVNRSIRAARQSLLEISKIEDTFKELHNGQAAYLQNSAENIKIEHYDPNSQKVGIDSITTFTSGEIMHENNSIESENQALLDRFSECGQEINGRFEIIDDQKCQSFLETDVEKQKKAIAELSLRTGAINQKINDMGEDEIRTYLEDEGFEDNEIENMIALAGGDINKVRQRINEHYDQERLSLVTSISKQLEQRTYQAENPEQNRSNLERIFNELTNRVDNFKSLVHYNNIVSGFLAVCDQPDISACTGENARINSAMINRELQNSAFSPGRTPADTTSGGDDYFTNLQSALDGRDLGESANEGNVDLNVDQINSHFLRYFKQP